MTAKALVLCGDGINCEQETAFALSQAGAEPTCVHINTLVERPGMLLDYPILALPGGFSFGDEVSSGKILAVKLRYGLRDMLRRFIESDRLVIGICNGFQALIKLGVLPRSDLLTQQVTLTHNRQGRFINQWVHVDAWHDNLFFAGLNQFMLPIRHGEGRLMVPQGEETAMNLLLQNHIALTYEHDVNGAFMNIAGLVNERGNVLGLMPHPEAFVRWTQHPAWTSLAPEQNSETAPGQQVFQNMVQAVRN